MAIEIERKFLVAGDGWRSEVARARRIVQGYLAREDGVTVRIRILDDSECRLTLKGSRTVLSRSEFEYDIPIEDGRELMAMCGEAVVEKTRHDVWYDNDKWEVDVFGGRHQGLVVAEIELDSETQAFARPDWLGAEVSHDSAYSNAALAGPA